MKKTLTFFSLIFAFFMLISCSKSTVPADIEKNMPEETNPTEANVTSLPAQQKEIDYGGREFTIAMYDSRLFLPALDSSPISLKILERNAKIENDYNIKFKALEGLTKENFFSDINTLYNADLFCGDLLVIPNYMIPLFVSQKMLMSVKALPFIELSPDYYDSSAVNSATLGNFVHAVYGDFTFMPDKNICVFFNKNLISQYSIQSPYEQDIPGTWTWESLEKNAAYIHENANAPRTSSSERIYGFSSSYSELEMTDIMFASCSQQFFENNPPYLCKMALNDEKAQNVIDKIRRLLYNDVSKIYIGTQKGISGYDVFLEGRALYCIAPLEKASEISAAGISFGIMPLPKADENSTYRAFTDSSAQAVCVLNNIPDSDFTGKVLQKIAQETDFDSEEYYKNYYITNFLTDNSSSLMLDKIFGNPYYDVAATLGKSYREIASASDELVLSHISTGIDFERLYTQNVETFDKFVSTSFTYKGE